MAGLVRLGCCLLVFSLGMSHAWAERGTGAPAVVLFSIDHCPSCLAAKAYLTERQIPFAEFNIDQSPKAKEVFDRLGARGAPFFLVQGKRLQGFHPEQLGRLLDQLK